MSFKSVLEFTRRLNYAFNLSTLREDLLKVLSDNHIDTDNLIILEDKKAANDFDFYQSIFFNNATYYLCSKTKFSKEAIDLVNFLCEYITNQHEIHNKLKRFEPYKLFFENAGDALLLGTIDDGFLVANNSAVKLFGSKNLNELLKLSPHDVSPKFQPDGESSEVKAERMMLKAVQKGQHYFEWRHQKVNGEEFDATVQLTMIDYFGKQGLLSVVRDKSAEIEAVKEFEVAKEQLLASAKLATLGQMAGGIAHEINNPIAIIYGYCKILENFIKDDNQNLEEYDKLIKSIKGTVDRISKIIKGLHSFSKKDNSDTFHPIDIRTVIEDTMSFIKQKFTNHNIKLEISIDAHSPIVKGSATQISQVILNLLSNAYDAVEFHDEKEISLTLTQNEYNAIIVISDTGPGIPDEIKEKILRPFFTTKSSSKGTGLGLSIVKDIMEKHLGKIEILSETKKTSFKITIPLYKEMAT